MLNALTTPRGSLAVNTTRGGLEQKVMPKLKAGIMGGTQFWLEVGITRVGAPLGTAVRCEPFFVDSGVPDPYEGAYDYRQIAQDKQTTSYIIGMSISDGHIQCPQEFADGGRALTHYKGNVVVAIDNEHLLVVSVSGLDEDWDEIVAHLFAAKLLFRKNEWAFAA